MSKFMEAFDRFGKSLSKSIGIGVTPEEQKAKLDNQIELEKRKAVIAALKAKTREANNKYKEEQQGGFLNPSKEVIQMAREM